MKARLEDLPVEFDQDGVEMRVARWGDMRVTRYTLAPGTDLTPFFAPLPRGLCEGQHWGIVLEGVLHHLRYADGTEESTRAGEVYHWPAGHTGWTDEGVAFLAVTPEAEEVAMEEQLAAAIG